MAKLRNVGKGLGTVANSVGGIIDAYIKQQLTEESQLRQDALMTERQRKLAELQSGLNRGDTAWSQLLQKPELAQRVSQNAPQTTNLGGIPIAPFKPTTSELQKPIIEQILKASDLNALPTSDAVRVQAQNAGFADPLAIDEVLKILESKQKTLTTEAQLKQNEQPRVMPQFGLGAYGFLDRSGNPVQTKYAGYEEGLSEHDKYVMGEGSQDVRDLKAKQVGAETGARELSTINTKYANLDKLKAIAEAEAQGRSSGSGGGLRMDLVIGPALKMIDLADQINQSDSEASMGDVASEAKYQLGDRVGGAVASATKSNPLINELNSLRNAYGVTVSSLLGHTGVKTQKDVESTLEILPDWGLRRVDSKKRNQNFIDLITAAAKMQQEFPPIDTRLTKEEQSAEYQRRLAMLKAAVTSGSFRGLTAPTGAATATIQDGQLILTTP